MADINRERRQRFLGIGLGGFRALESYLPKPTLEVTLNTLLEL